MPLKAVLSHAAPWMPSGQSVILGRLLGALDPSEILLVGSPRTSSSRPPADLPYAFEQMPPEPALRRVPAFAEFAFRRLLRGRRLSILLRKREADSVIACTGDVFDLPAAAAAASATGIPLINHIFDEYAAQWSGTRFAAAARVAEGRLLAGARTNIVTNELMAADLASRHGASCEVVRNPFGPEWEALPGRSGRTAGEPLRIVFAGSIYTVNRDCFSCLMEVPGLPGPGIRLELFTSQSAEDLLRLGLDPSRAVLRGRTGTEGLLRAVAEADILYLPLGFDRACSGVVRTASPAKMGEYLVSGRPVLAHVPGDCFVGRYFSSNRCGALVDGLDAAVLRNALAGLAADGASSAARAGECGRRDFSPEESGRAYRRALSLG